MVSRVALVTGCGKQTGIGAAVARSLAASGVTVVVSSVAPREAGPHPGLQALVGEITAAGGTASATLGDVSSEADVARMVRETIARHGSLDILVNNAGAPKGKDRGPIEDVPLDAWELQMAINARGVFLMSREVVPAMKKRGWGRIIQISSASAKVGGKYQAVYGASKAAVVGFSISLAVELGPFGITVNAICPYSIFTHRSLESARATAGSDDPAAIEAAIASKAKAIPVQRHGRPDEVGAMVVYLASEDSGFVTGQAFNLCGGTTFG